ncbi:hypothetical protein LWI28_016013 [Acer negundo]|uniref:Bifunctional inhibitor/plant lipid transfer protein/seed storage helical domain-containing protein n=1 Tax=Acer negundo TaxID=4023 RepID=A0AAD5J681_ACENE|nr:hypothetical protein LWI28_016013 [Acer negundo]
MAKLTLLLATFTLFLLAANATIYRTTVAISDEENSSLLQHRCQQPIQEQQELNQCKMFMSQLTGPDPGQLQSIQQCCQQLEPLDLWCRCYGIEDVTRSQVRQEQLGDHQKKLIFQIAQTIPLMCGLRPLYCGFGTRMMINDEENRSGHQQQCQQQFQEQQELHQCKSFLSRRIQGGANPGQQQGIRQCCHQLERLDTECRCPGLKQVTRSQVSQSQLGDQQKRQIIEIAESIPSMCNMRPMECDFESSRSDILLQIENPNPRIRSEPCCC